MQAIMAILYPYRLSVRYIRGIIPDLRIFLLLKNPSPDPLLNYLNESYSSNRSNCSHTPHISHLSAGNVHSNIQKILV